MDFAMPLLLISVCWMLSLCKPVLSQQSRPNFIIILVDDQDLLMDSPSYMPNLQSLIVNEGMTFSNAFVATPVCCPSRTEFVSGRYYHNIGAPNGNCMFINANEYVFNSNSIFSKMYQNGYKTGIFGKLTNNDGQYFCNSPENVTKAGMSRVYSMCQTDNYYALKYINYTEKGSVPTDSAGNIKYQYTNLSYNDPGSYQGAQIGNKSIEFIEKQLKLNNNFLAYIGFHEPHIEYTPAAWFANAFSNVSLPQNPSFNYQLKNHMPWLNTQPALNDTNIKDMTKIYQDRLASTLQVDLAINEIYNLLSSYNQLNNTYIIYFSDHGYHLGQYRIPCEKYQAFDTDIRVPYYIRGPGIKPNSKTDIVVGNVDVLPTVLDIAGVSVPDSVDGKSFKSQILADNNNTLDNPWRDVFLVEFLSPFQQYFNRCTTWYPKTNDFHGQTKNPSPFTTNGELVWVNFGKKQNPGNNYREIRIINSTHDWAYTEYLNYTFTENDKKNPWLYVLFDLNKDPYELDNIYSTLNDNVKVELHEMLMEYGSCQGSTCP